MTGRKSRAWLKTAVPYHGGRPVNMKDIYVTGTRSAISTAITITYN